MSRLSVASFNAHAAMDGWGARWDLAEACKRLDADVIVLQELFAPLEGPSQATTASDELGYTPTELPLSRAWRRKQPLAPSVGWEPRKILPVHERAMRVGGRVDINTADLEGYEEGTWGIAVLSRVPIESHQVISLGKLKRDFTPRGALILDLEVGFTVVGTHAAHLTAGSPLQFARLREKLPSPTTPAALAGDMNLWGPPLSLMFPRWSRAVKGRTWPAWRPHSQTDHILVTPPVHVESSRVLQPGNSDHRAVFVQLVW